MVILVLYHVIKLLISHVPDFSYDVHSNVYVESSMYA
jgi:hypothetical protein